MANYYVYSGAGGAANGTSWANAYTTFALAIAGSVAAGDTVYVAHDHAESTAGSITHTWPGTAASPVRVICVNRAGSVPPVSADLATTATVTTTGNAGITISGTSAHVYFYGITFNAGTGAVAAQNLVSVQYGYFKKCAFKKNGTTATAGAVIVGLQNGGSRIIFDETTVQFGNTSDSIAVRSEFHWRNTTSAITGATLPTTLFANSSAGAGIRLIEGVDLSALGSGKTLVAAHAVPARFIFKDCQFGSSVTVSATHTTPGGATVDVIRSDSADTNYRNERYNYMGTQTTETTIVRSSGASDGTTPFSWKIDTTANPEWIAPFKCLPISIWNETGGSAITLTVEGVWDAGAVPNDDDIWIEVEYLGTSGFPIDSVATDGKADPLASAAAQDSSSVTWTTTGLATPVKFKLVKQITAQEKGPITVTICAAKASSTFYIDPVITVS